VREHNRRDFVAMLERTTRLNPGIQSEAVGRATPQKTRTSSDEKCEAEDYLISILVKGGGILVVF